MEQEILQPTFTEIIASFIEEYGFSFFMMVYVND